MRSVRILEHSKCSTCVSKMNCVARVKTSLRNSDRKEVLNSSKHHRINSLFCSGVSRNSVDYKSTKPGNE